MNGGIDTAGLSNELVGALIEQGARDLTTVDIDVCNGDTGWTVKKRVRRTVCSFPRQADSHHFDALNHSGQIDNGIAVAEFNGDQRAVMYTSRTFAQNEETRAEIIGMAGKSLAGHGAAREHVVTSNATGVRYRAIADLFERLSVAFERGMQVSSCRGGQPLPPALAEASEAARIGLTITRSMHTRRRQAV